MKDGIVFLHPMKTAMTSIARFIGRELDACNPRIEATHFEGHETPQELMWRLDVPGDWFEKRYCVLFVRNPYDRLVSFYHHMRHPKLGGHARGLCLRKSFSEFVNEPELTQIVKPMTAYTTCNGKNIIDFLGKYESLDADVDRLVGRIGLDSHEEIKTLWRECERYMKTEHEHYETYYDNALKKIVFDAYKEDFVLFGYGG